MSQSTTRTGAADEPDGAFCPSGYVLTVLRRDHVIVWLIGEIDLNLALDLDDIAEHVPRVTQQLVIDGSRVSFCDSTLLRFVATVAVALPVTIRRPSPIFADILTLSGLREQVSIHSEPGAPR